jgi:hypothetical protein
MNSDQNLNLTNKNIKKNQIGFKKRKRLSKKQRKERHLAGIFQHIQNKQQLMYFLSQEKNAYNSFMLQLIKKQENLNLGEIQKNEFAELHHILPLSANGPDECWNLVAVTFEQHALAHQLRFLVYGQHSDLLAYKSRQNMPPNAIETKSLSSKIGHQTMKTFKIGWYNSQVQSELGKRAAGKKTEAREKAYVKQTSSALKTVFLKRLKFTHKQLNLEIESLQYQFQRPGQIKDFLLNNMPEKEELRLKIEKDKYFTCNISKILYNLLDFNLFADLKKKARKTYKGWTVKVEHVF